MNDTIIILLLIIAGWWSGLIPFLLVALLGAVIAILSGIEKLTYTRMWRRYIRRPWRAITRSEEREIRRIMEKHKRQYPHLSVKQLVEYEAGLRSRRERNRRRAMGFEED